MLSRPVPFPAGNSQRGKRKSFRIILTVAGVVGVKPALQTDYWIPNMVLQHFLYSVEEQRHNFKIFQSQLGISLTGGEPALKTVPMMPVAPVFLTFPKLVDARYHALCCLFR